MSKAPESIPPVERRKEYRRRVLLSGLIFVSKTHCTFNCLIRNISESGARIDIQAESPLPERFSLIAIKNCVAYEVQIVRRRGPEVGLKILRRIPLMEASSSEALQLRRLLVERLNR
jgi:hypothetical protein